MATKVTDVDTLSQYLRGVMNRAEHHAGGVDAVALTVAGAVLWRKDPKALEIYSKEGQAGNVLWVHIANRRYALSYNHDAEAIEVRDNSTQGDVMATFDNTASADDVKEFFAAL